MLDNLEMMERELKRRDDEEAKLIKRYFLKDEYFDVYEDALEYADYLTEIQIDDEIDKEFGSALVAGVLYKTSKLLYKIDYEKYKLFKGTYLKSLIDSIEEVYINEKG